MIRDHQADGYSHELVSPGIDCAHQKDTWIPATSIQQESWEKTHRTVLAYHRPRS